MCLILCHLVMLLLSLLLRSRLLLSTLPHLLLLLLSRKSPLLLLVLPQLILRRLLVRFYRMLLIIPQLPLLLPLHRFLLMLITSCCLASPNCRHSSRQLFFSSAHLTSLCSLCSSSSSSSFPFCIRFPQCSCQPVVFQFPVCSMLPLFAFFSDHFNLCWFRLPVSDYLPTFFFV